MKFFFIATILISTFFIYTDYSYSVEPPNIVSANNIGEITDNKTSTSVVTIDIATDNKSSMSIIATDNITDNKSSISIIATDNITDNKSFMSIIATDNITDNKSSIGIVVIDNATDNKSSIGIVVIDNATDNKSSIGIVVIDNATDDLTEEEGFKLDRRGKSYLYLMLASGADADNYITRHFNGFFVGLSGGLQLFNWFAVELGVTFRQALLNQLEIKTAIFFQPVIPIGSRFELVPRIGLGMINTFSLNYANSANEGLDADMSPSTNMLGIIGIRFNIDDRYIIGIVGENDIFGVSQRYRYGLEFGIKF